MTTELKTPYPWFGGKRKIAPLVWRRFGVVTNFVEPFYGGGHVHLSRPLPFAGVETINDLDCYVSNFWRCVKLGDPVKLAAECDWPISELDLHARHRWLVYNPDAAAFRDRMRQDPDHFDYRYGAWWIWGLCQWIGAGWCSVQSEGGAWNYAAGSEKRPRMHGGAGYDPPGILSGAAGKQSQGRPQLGDAYAPGRGIHANATDTSPDARIDWLADWFRRLQNRLRMTRILCGDWKRTVASESVTTRLGDTAVFLDPPYANWTEEGEQSRAANLYSAGDTDPDTVVKDVQAWCRENGERTGMRIAVCGLTGEGYESLERLGWRVEAWKTKGGYGNMKKDVAARSRNRERERIWFSPYCCYERDLFDAAGLVD